MFPANIYHKFIIFMKLIVFIHIHSWNLSKQLWYFSFTIATTMILKRTVLSVENLQFVNFILLWYDAVRMVLPWKAVKCINLTVNVDKRSWWQTVWRKSFIFTSNCNLDDSALLCQGSLQCLHYQLSQSLYTQAFDIFSISWNQYAFLCETQTLLTNVSPSLFVRMKWKFTFPSILNGNAPRFRLTGGLVPATGMQVDCQFSKDCVAGHEPWKSREMDNGKCQHLVTGSLRLDGFQLQEPQSSPLATCEIANSWHT